MAKIEMEGSGVRISIEASEEGDKANDWGSLLGSIAEIWATAMGIASRARLDELRVSLEQAKVERATRIEGNAAGFQIERADLTMNDNPHIGGEGQM